MRASNTPSSSRSKSPATPETAYTTAATVSITAKSGVKSMVRTGAMFSTTRCFDSTSHAATTTAPATPDGSTHSTTRSATSVPIGSSTSAVSPMSTPPPMAMRA